MLERIFSRRPRWLEELGVLGTVVLVEVESEAEEAQAEVRMRTQHQQELLHHVLSRKNTTK